MKKAKPQGPIPPSPEFSGLSQKRKGEKKDLKRVPLPSALQELLIKGQMPPSLDLSAPLGADLEKSPDTYAKLEKSLSLLDREPFVKKLADALRISPSEFALRRMAEKSPEKWINYLSGLARLVGYSDKLEVSLSVEQRVEEMSDAQVEAELKRLEDLAEERGLQKTILG